MSKPQGFYDDEREVFIQAILSASRETWKAPENNYDSDWRGSQVEWDDDEYMEEHPVDPDVWEGDEECVN